MYHPTCKESIPTKCASNEWTVDVPTGWEIDYNFTISCGNHFTHIQSLTVPDFVITFFHHIVMQK